jgi:hypothetical protein
VRSAHRHLIQLQLQLHLLRDILAITGLRRLFAESRKATRRLRGERGSGSESEKGKSKRKSSAKRAETVDFCLRAAVPAFASH